MKTILITKGKSKEHNVIHAFSRSVLRQMSQNGECESFGTGMELITDSKNKNISALAQTNSFASTMKIINEAIEKSLQVYLIEDSDFYSVSRYHEVHKVGTVGVIYDSLYKNELTEENEFSVFGTIAIVQFFMQNGL